LDTARRKVRNFEFDIDRALALGCLARTTHAASKASSHTAAMLIVTFDRWQAEFCTHEEFFTATELLNLPNDG
jgi:hypothetical protein